MSKALRNRLNENGLHCGLFLMNWSHSTSEKHSINCEWSFMNWWRSRLKLYLRDETKTRKTLWNPNYILAKSLRCWSEAWGKQQGGAQGGIVLKEGMSHAIAATKAWVSHPKAKSAQANASTSPGEVSRQMGQKQLTSSIKSSYLQVGSDGCGRRRIASSSFIGATNPWFIKSGSCFKQ